MTERDPLGTALEDLVPPFEDDSADWNDVLRRADALAPGATGRRPRHLRVLAIAAVGALAAICAFALADPFAEDQAGVLDRALAAVGDGPVLHVVTSLGPGGTLVDLESGERERVRTERESWFDPARGYRSITRLGSTQVEEYGAGVDQPIRLRSVDRAMQVFTRDYRDALRSGRARVLRDGEVAGTPVHWIRVTLARRAPRGSPCGRHLCQDVAISRETYEPVFVQYGPARLGWGERILEIESLPAGSAEIPGSATSHVLPGFQPLPRREADRALARRLLGTRLVWPGRRLSGLALARMEAGGTREFRAQRPTRRPRFRPPDHVITLLFGARQDIRSGRPPRRWRPLLVVNEGRRPSYDLLRSPVPPRFGQFGIPVGYLPAQGKALVAPDGRQAILRRRGLAIGVVGTSPDLVRAALEALTRAR
jgi:hypothetical protein